MNEDKSHWYPTQVGEWLGFVINTITVSFHIPERKVEKLTSLLGSVIGDTSFSYRELARIAGSIISVALVVGPISRLLTRQCTWQLNHDQRGTIPFVFLRLFWRS